MWRQIPPLEYSPANKCIVQGYPCPDAQVQRHQLTYGRPEGTASVTIWNAVTRSEFRSRTRALARRIDLELGRSIGESIANSVARSENRSRTRSRDQRISNSVAQSENRSQIRSLDARETRRPGQQVCSCVEALNAEVVGGAYNSTKLSQGCHMAARVPKHCLDLSWAIR